MQRYIILLFIPLAFTGCNSGSKSGDRKQKEVLTVTIEPQRFFLDQIVGDKFSVNTLVPAGTSPETYEPAPSVMIDMAKSHLYFKVGNLGFEKAWSKRLAENNPDVEIVDCSVGIELMDGHDHGHSGDHEGHDHGAMDPHVWSSPKAVKIFSRNMFEAVVAADPANESFYSSNYDAFIVKIDSIDNLVKDILEDAPTRSFIIYHPALGYFAHDYGLHQYSIEFEGKNPSPSQVKGLVDLARAENIKTVFVQKGFDQKNAQVIAEEIGAEIFEIDPLSYNWGDELIRIASIIAGGQSRAN